MWLSLPTLADCQLCVLAVADDFHFGVLSSTFHEVWSLAIGGRKGIGNDPNYDNSRCLKLAKAGGLSIQVVGIPDDPHAQLDLIAPRPALKGSGGSPRWAVRCSPGPR